MNPTLLVICVNYHSENMTIEYVKQLLKQSGGKNFKIVVVDNNEDETNDKLNSLTLEGSNIMVFRPRANLGYFNGAAMGLNHFLENNPFPEWIIVSNTDISFPTDNFFDTLFQLYQDSSTAVLAPSIITKVTNLNQNPFMLSRPKTITMHFNKWIFRYYPISIFYQFGALLKQRLEAIIGKHRISRTQKSGGIGSKFELKPSNVYAPHGSFIIFQRSYFEADGNLNYGAFLFCEEIFVAETVRKLGLTVTFDPRLKVIHHEHATTGFFKNRQMAGYLGEASAYCANKFFNK